MAKNYTVTTRDKVRGILLPPPNMDALPWGAPPSSAAYGAINVLADDGTVLSTEIPEERFLPFSKPGLRVASDQLVTVKAMGPAGNVAQLPMEKQINNHVASPEDYVGIRYYERKGFTVFFDYEKGKGAFCPTKNCHAEWNDKFEGFCCAPHKAITQPNNSAGRFGEGATTTASTYRV